MPLCLSLIHILKADTKQTSQSVASAPPAGEVVLDLDEMGTDYPQKVLL